MVQRRVSSRVEVVVVGLPLTMRGEEGAQAKKILGFSDTLRHRVSVPVQLVDERLTTVQGERALRETGATRRKRKQTIDQVAAQLILQQFLDVQRQTAG
jgi:putative Holliday junction resolvase